MSASHAKASPHVDSSEKSKSWIGQLVGKAFNKATGVGVEAIAGGIAQAISGYLGQ